MRYIKNRSHYSQKKKSPGKGRWVLFLLFVVVVIVGAVLLSGSDEEEVGKEVVELLSDGVVEKEEVVQEDAAAADFTQEDVWSQEITLIDVEGAGGSGVSRRGVSGELFTHVIVADLPAIDLETTYYEGWLVIPGVVEFFSTGEMFTREDGKWGLVWEVKLADAPDDLLDYREVIITRELRDGNVAPSPEHVIEGQFE